MRMLAGIIQKITEGAPPLTPAEKERLENPEFEVSQQIIDLIPIVMDVPIEHEAWEDLKPLIELAMRQIALECEVHPDHGGDDTRETARAWLAEVEEVVSR